MRGTQPAGGVVPSDGDRITGDQKAAIEETFGRHVNRGQVRYLKAGHLDVLESRRQGIRFVDPVTGRRMIDCFTSAGCFNVGRHNPVVVAALEEALDSLDLGSALLTSAHQVALADKLAEIAPGDLSRVLFAAGGGDAVDGAIKLARGATGRSGIVSTVKAYHGHTGFALSANGKPHYRHYCEPLMPAFSFVPFNDLEAMRQVVGDRTAAVLVEPVQGEAGIFLGDRAYLEGLRSLCDERGALLVFDEVQTGFGRTGKMFACEHVGVVPDVMTVAKALGGGLFPNAAILYRDVEPMRSFVESNPYFHRSMVGGSDLGCRVSLRVIEYIEQEDLCGNAARMGGRLREALEQLMGENPKIIRAVRGIGLMVGIEYIHEFLGPMMSDALAKRGVFAAYSGNAPQVMRFMLPIIVNDEELDEVIAAIRGAIADMRRLLPLALPAAKLPFGLRLLNDERVQTSLFGAFRKVEDMFGGKER
jgi:putrescine aminotransferase